MNRRACLAALAAAFAVACHVDSSAAPASADAGTDASSTPDGAGDAHPASGYTWNLPEGFPPPNVPEDNPMSDAKVELGHYLFYDPRVSFPESRSCSTCHVQEFGFTTASARGPGLKTETRRNVIALAVPVYQPVYLWADSRVTRIEEVVAQTLVDENEFGGAGHEADVVARLTADSHYSTLFQAAFGAEPVSFNTISKAIASFTRTIVSGDSPYDRYVRGDTTALSDSALRGREAFISERFECYHCHNGVTMGGSVTYKGLLADEIVFENTGLYNVDGQGAYPAGDTGLFEVTGRASDMGRFKAVSLRNVAVTGPYMHDGSIATLEEVLDAYAAGGRAGLHGGTRSPLCSSIVRVLSPPITADEKADLIAFLQSFTDTAFLHDPRFANPR